MLDDRDLSQVAHRFGVGEQQVRRDHLISHVLAALPTLAPDAVFFGGTALSRTHVPYGRLSEDIDLYADDCRAVRRRLTEDLPRALRKEFPGLRWDPPPANARQPEAAILLSPRGPGVRVQVLDGAGYRVWPTERRAVDGRYRDVTQAELVVPTRPAFVGMKVAAWAERRAARDLYDLWALALLGAVDVDAAAVFRHAAGSRPHAGLFDRPPRDDWTTALAHQTAALPPVEDALRVVREAFGALDSS